MNGPATAPGTTARTGVVVVGSVNADHRIEVARLPAPGETVLGGPPAVLGGGKGANQAVALARLGHPVALVGAVGADPTGERLRHDLAAEGIDVCWLDTAEAPTGQAVVLVDPDGENCIVVSPGANAAVGPRTVRAARAAVSGAAVVVAQLEIPMDAVLEAARLATGTFVLNPAPAAAVPAELWPHVDVLVPNRGELAQLCGAPEPQTAQEAAELARRLPCPRVVVTLGAAGAVVVDEQGTAVLTPPAVRAVDTTGAGDCFCGALAGALAEGRTLREAAALAVRAAAHSVQHSGAQAAMPTRAQAGALGAGGTPAL
ncbi:MAG TPA: ribokinase [Streptomyces sp.]|nr:ribokinase [Streptomyces sp.]